MVKLSLRCASSAITIMPVGSHSLKSRLFWLGIRGVGCAEQVMKIAAQFRNKESLERLRTGAQPLPSLIQPKKKGRPQSLRTEPVQPQVLPDLR